MPRISNFSSYDAVIQYFENNDFNSISLNPGQSALNLPTGIRLINVNLFRNGFYYSVFPSFGIILADQDQFIITDEAAFNIQGIVTEVKNVILGITL